MGLFLHIRYKMVTNFQLIVIFFFHLVTLGFFDDILIPPAALQHPSRFEEAEQAWVWEYPLDDGEKHDLFMDIGEPIKFRVSRELFEESSPIGPPKGDLQQQQTSASTASTGQQNEVKTPYRIIVSIIDFILSILFKLKKKTFLF